MINNPKNITTMKTQMLKFTIFSVILLILVVGLASCKDKPPPIRLCIKERPKDLKPINWEDYNDVYTIYWTYDGRDTREKEMEILYEDTVEIIKIYGWIARILYSPGGPYGNTGFMEFVLVGNEIDDYFYNHPHVRFGVVGDWMVMSLLNEKLGSADLTKKCYVRGKLSFYGIHIDFEDGSCDLIFPVVRIYSVDDVYFE